MPITPDDLPRHIDGVTVAQLTLFALRSDGATDELTITALHHTAAAGSDTASAGPITTVNGIIGTRRPGSASWQPLLHTDPTGTWKIVLEDTPAVRATLTDGRVQDIALVMTLAGTTQPWP